MTTKLADKGTVKALRQLLVTASDFEVRGIIGRGHFGEVGVQLFRLLASE